jgi:hypothetical protein
MHYVNSTASMEQVSQDRIDAIIELVHSGLSLEEVSFTLEIDIETIQQIFADSPMHRTSVAPQLHKDTLPSFMYSYKFSTSQLQQTSLVTGEQSIHRVPSFTFKPLCCWSEVPGGSVLITGGGGMRAVSEVVRIDTRREFAVSELPPMLTPRRAHAAVYRSQKLYCLGEHSSVYLSECERYVCAENRWETLPPLPIACSNTSGVVVESSLYALGGFVGTPLDWVQKLSLESLTWELMLFRLPHAGWGIPCFKLRDTEVYLVVNKTLCLFSALQVRLLKTLSVNMNSWCGASYYRRGSVYCSNYESAVRSHEIGSLSN